MGSRTGARLSRGCERRELHGLQEVVRAYDVGRRVGDPRLRQLGLGSDEEQVLSIRGNVSIR